VRSFNDKTVVITGGATGIGFALARQFGRLAANLVLAARPADRLDQAARTLEQEGVAVRTFFCDVTDRTLSTSPIGDRPVSEWAGDGISALQKVTLTPASAH
jgi:short-subunit dehydrogenase